MSHLTPTDVRSISQLCDAAILFLEFTGNREPAIRLLLEGIRFFLPTLAAGLEIVDLGSCSEQYYREGLLTFDEYSKIQKVLAPSK